MDIICLPFIFKLLIPFDLKILFCMHNFNKVVGVFYIKFMEIYLFKQKQVPTDNPGQNPIAYI